MLRHVVVRCDGCGHEATVTSRSELGILQELHTVACSVFELSTSASVDDMLALRPYAVDITDTAVSILDLMTESA